MATKTNETKAPATYEFAYIMEGPEGNQYPIGFTSKWANGKELNIPDVRVLPVEMQMWCMCHGFKQKSFDAAAIARSTKTGQSATVDDKFNAVEAVFNRIVFEHDWNAERTGGGSGSYLFKAICRMKPNQTPEQVKEWLAKKSDAERAALEINTDVAKVIAQLKAEKVNTDGIDSAKMLADLD